MPNGNRLEAMLQCLEKPRVFDPRGFSRRKKEDYGNDGSWYQLDYTSEGERRLPFVVPIPFNIIYYRQFLSS